jgi:thiamine biosynthesis lipoprotein
LLRRMRPLLGSFVEVAAHGPGAAAAIDAAFACIEKAQARWSFQDVDSELSRLNRAPGNCVALHSDTLRLLRVAKTLMQRSAGAFDCTVGGMLVQAGVLPDHAGPGAIERGVAEDIELGADWARLRRPLRLTLDGIAKGYAVDCAIHALRCGGTRDGWINAGGDLRVFGAVSLPVQRRELDGSFSSLGVLRNAAMASSRVPTAAASVEENAAFPARIVAPVGLTPQPGIWTVLARSAWRADALTKVAATVASGQRRALIADLGGCLIDPTFIASRESAA